MHICIYILRATGRRCVLTVICTRWLIRRYIHYILLVNSILIFELVEIFPHKSLVFGMPSVENKCGASLNKVGYSALARSANIPGIIYFNTDGGVVVGHILLLPTEHHIQCTLRHTVTVTRNP